MNSKVKAYPYTRDHNFGPGLPYADDRWELRKALKVRMTLKNADHPYKYKDFYLDKETTGTPLLLRPRPQERALEADLAQQALE